MSYEVRIHFRCDKCGVIREEVFGPILQITLPWNVEGYIEFPGPGSPLWFCTPECLLMWHQEQKELQSA